jgi:hypothetical protein
MKALICLFAASILLWAGGANPARGSDQPQGTNTRVAAGAASLDPATPGSRLTALDEEHARQSAAWKSAILQAPTAALRDSLEQLVPGWKQAQRREWLTLRLEQERARGDLDKVARLEAELARVVPPVAPLATTFVPREATAQGGRR